MLKRYTFSFFVISFFFYALTLPLAQKSTHCRYHRAHTELNGREIARELMHNKVLAICYQPLISPNRIFPNLNGYVKPNMKSIHTLALSHSLSLHSSPLISSFQCGSKPTSISLLFVRLAFECVYIYMCVWHDTFHHTRWCFDFDVQSLCILWSSHTQRHTC